jgi:hypothetical protein
MGGASVRRERWVGAAWDIDNCGIDIADSPGGLRYYHRGHSRQIRPIGVPIVALGERYTRSVVFIAGTNQTGKAMQAELRGTGFVVGVPAANPEGMFLYVVTAAHVVRPFASTFVRVTKADGSIKDEPLDRWVFHPTEDVAVTPYMDATGQFFHSFVETGNFVGQTETQFAPAPGDDVYFVGLLGQVPSMGKRNLPMVRSGSVGALYQDGIPIRLPDDTVLHVGGHLIDCRSFGGFSGSPCFVRFVSGRGETKRKALPYPIESTLLLGMVGGHFDLKASVALPAQEDKLKVPVAAGIAVLSTAETIMETLNEEKLVTEREEDNERYRRRTSDEERDMAATLDSADSEDEFGRFEDLTRKLVQVPKSEIDEERKGS